MEIMKAEVYNRKKYGGCR